jgi:hypothetical protein
LPASVILSQSFPKMLTHRLAVLGERRRSGKDGADSRSQPCLGAP